MESHSLYILHPDRLSMVERWKLQVGGVEGYGGGVVAGG